MAKKETLALKRAVESAGGQSALARACGVKQGHVWHWLNKSLRVPAEYVLAVEAATGGSVSRHELRPDIFGDEGGSSTRAEAVNGDRATGDRAAASSETPARDGIAEQIASLEAKQHRVVREVLLKQSGAAERLAKLDRGIAALRAIAGIDK